MADGYIEQRMEEHRSGKGAACRTSAGRGCSTSSSHTPRGSRRGEWVLRFTPCQVFIEEIEKEINLRIARELIAIGFKVCFRHDDIHRGQKLASTIGGRLLPASLSPEPDAITVAHRADTDTFTISRHGTNVDVRDSAPLDLMNSIIFAAVSLAKRQGQGETS